MRTLLHVLIGLCILLPMTGRAEEYRPVTTVAVMPFAKLQGDNAVWLDKAIADIVTQKLTESNRYGVLNRDALKTFLSEMQLEQSGFVDDPQALARIGKVARVAQVVYGNYTLEGSRITLHSMVMDVASQTIRSRQTVSGEVNAIIPLCGQLVDALLNSEHIALSPAEQANVSFKPTDSLPAMEHFYNGLYAYDKGDYETAMGEFFAARKQDPDYLDATLWFARMMEQLGKDDEAIAVYLELYAKSPHSIEGIDACYFAARLQEKAHPEDALKTYRLLADIRPEIPETLEAAYAAAHLYRTQNAPEKAYALYKQVDDFSANVRKHIVAYAEQWQKEADASQGEKQQSWNRLIGNALPVKDAPQEKLDVRYIAYSTRHSRFFAWEHALGLYRESITAMVELYRDLPLNAQGATAYPPPRGSYVIDPAHPVAGGDVKDMNQSLFGGDHTFYADWKEAFYALIIPKGYEATGTLLQITGQLPDATPTRDFTLRVMPFPLPQNYLNTWLGVIFGQTETVTTLKKETPFFGNDQHILAAQLVENHGIISHWQVTVRLRKENAPAPAPVAPAVDTNTEGALLAKIRLGDTDSHTIQSMPLYILQAQPKQKLTLADDGDGTLWLVGVKGELYGQGTDLWITHSSDGGTSWTKAEPMTVNSASQEFAPTLVRAEDGTLQLFFLSNRRGLGWELWTSTQERKSRHWSHPSLVPLRDTASTGFENDNDHTDSVLPYAVMQDSHGQWLVGIYSPAAGQMFILASDDLTHWRLHSQRRSDGIGSLALGQDATDKYYLLSVDSGGNPSLYLSNDAKEWEFGGTIWKKYANASDISGYPLTLLKKKGEGMLLLFSDIYTGLQYASLAPGAIIQPDLVTGSGLEPYAAAASQQGIVTALWKDDDIYIQRYHRLALPENGVNSPDEIIYTERSHDRDKGLWERIFARERYRVPDVTAVGASPEGRAWWGMETGIMSLKGSDFFFSDVSQGFFSHDVDIIRHCGATTWFASSDLDMPQVGFAQGNNPASSEVGKPLRFSEISGNISALACGGKGQTYFGTTQGEVLLSPAEGARKAYRVKGDKIAIRALAFDPVSSRLLVGTDNGELNAMNAQGEFSPVGHFSHTVGALAVDRQGRLWAAVEEEGLFVLGAQGKTVKTYGVPAVPANIKKLVADPVSGVWAIAQSDSPASGLMHIDMHGVQLINPPQETLRDIIDFDIADDGSLWLGTNLKGIYHYRRAQ